MKLAEAIKEQRELKRMVSRGISQYIKGFQTKCF